MQKYKPLLRPATKNWDEIEETFLKLKQEGLDVTQMLELTTYIIKSGLSQRLYGIVSLKNLIISIYPEIDYNKETIFIEFDNVNRKWHFRYVAEPFKEPEFIRVYDEGFGVPKFKQFIDWIKW
ncbi:hypothetical protein [Catalinimonas niigatensis]|uniref:hypothetical protein n=1 Tax=Catalinimonas niigatensis TaxID=1397264 RepID=UPI002664FC6C|nr:hypothetical protein [Catalinimonas niigatensis]WPP48911.1 hypothetical protein PZB72_19790 [Catalinimonas niigatensis]